jgi:hypothetical protein
MPEIMAKQAKKTPLAAAFFHETDKCLFQITYHPIDRGNDLLIGE